MNGKFHYVVDEAVFTALLVLSNSQVAGLVAIFEALADDPIAEADGYVVDAHGADLCPEGH